MRGHLLTFTYADTFHCMLAMSHCDLRFTRKVKQPQELQQWEIGIEYIHSWIWADIMSMPMTDWGMLVKWPRGSLDWHAAESQQVLHNLSRLDRVLSALFCFLPQGLVSALFLLPFLPRLAECHLLFKWGLMVATRWQYLWVLCFHWRVKAASGKWGCMLRNEIGPN